MENIQPSVILYMASSLSFLLGFFVCAILTASKRSDDQQPD